MGGCPTKDCERGRGLRRRVEAERCTKPGAFAPQHRIRSCCVVFERLLTAGRLFDVLGNFPMRLVLDWNARKLGRASGRHQVGVLLETTGDRQAHLAQPPSGRL